MFLLDDYLYWLPSRFCFHKVWWSHPRILVLSHMIVTMIAWHKSHSTQFAVQIFNTCHVPSTTGSKFERQAFTLLSIWQISVSKTTGNCWDCSLVTCCSNSPSPWSTLPSWLLAGNEVLPPSGVSGDTASLAGTLGLWWYMVPLISAVDWVPEWRKPVIHYMCGAGGTTWPGHVREVSQALLLVWGVYIKQGTGVGRETEREIETIAVTLVHQKILDWWLHYF